MRRLRIHRSALLLIASAAAIIAAVIAVLNTGSSSAAGQGSSAATTHTSSSSLAVFHARLKVAGLTPPVLTKYGIEISPVASPSGTSPEAQVGQATAIQVVQAQGFASSSAGVKQVLLAHVTFSSRHPVVSGSYWVVSLTPTGDIPIFGGPNTTHPKIPASYLIAFVNAATGNFEEAITG